MNLQLQFQMLLYEAIIEGVPVESARCVQFDSFSNLLTVYANGRRYCVEEKSAEEKAALKKRHPILDGPDAMALTLHIAEMKESLRNDLSFCCPTFRESAPIFAPTIADTIGVRFTRVKQRTHHEVYFEGYTFVYGGYNRLAKMVLPLQGEYDSYTKTGWMSGDLFSGIRTHRLKD